MLDVGGIRMQESDLRLNKCSTIRRQCESFMSDGCAPCKHGHARQLPISPLDVFFDAPHTASEQVCDEFSSRESWCGSTQACNHVKLQTVQSEQKSKEISSSDLQGRRTSQCGRSDTLVCIHDCPHCWWQLTCMETWNYVEVLQKSHMLQLKFLTFNPTDPLWQGSERI
jgi:hypothetical protein